MAWCPWRNQLNCERKLQSVSKEPRVSNPVLYAVIPDYPFVQSGKHVVRLNSSCDCVVSTDANWQHAQPL